MVLNIIFAGDFAQLPTPMKSSPLYSDLSNHKSSSYIDQETCIGKTLWHQATTVVILQSNMHQNSQSVDDKRLHTPWGSY